MTLLMVMMLIVIMISFHIIQYDEVCCDSPMVGGCIQLKGVHLGAGKLQGEVLSECDVAIGGGANTTHSSYRIISPGWHTLHHNLNPNPCCAEGECRVILQPLQKVHAYYYNLTGGVRRLLQPLHKVYTYYYNCRRKCLYCAILLNCYTTILPYCNTTTNLQEEVLVLGAHVLVRLVVVLTDLRVSIGFRDKPGGGGSTG